MKYDEKFLIRKLRYVNIIAKNIKNFISFESEWFYLSLRFIDSYKFLSSSLEKLTQNLLNKGKENFHFTKKEFPNHFDLCLRKGVFPYDYVTEDKVLNEKELPSKKNFYSKLLEQDISDEDYEHAKNVWKTFNSKTLRDYQQLYLKLDCCLLADIFEQFRELIFSEYELDPAHYITLPSLAMDCALKHSGQELELISDPTIYNFLESGIRGGISMICKRFAESNNKYQDDYDPEKESSYITYFDANNLYGAAMSEPLPVSNFKFEDVDWQTQDCVVDCDISCPEELKEKFKDYPLCPEHRNGKLMCTFYPKKNYVCHSRYLKEVLRHGYVLDSVNRVLTFTSKPWLKSYIEKNTFLRSQSISEFEKDLWKLMNNAVYGKQIENVRNRNNILFCHNKENLKKLISKT